jgi:hypothetical protein
MNTRLVLRPARPIAYRLWSFALGTGFVLVVATCSDSSSEPVNSPPVAAVEAVSGVLRGDTVVLDGSGSSDADGDSLTFVWTLTAVPAGSGAALSSSDDAHPSFVADRVGNYAVTLVVSDGSETSAPDVAALTVDAPSPTVVLSSPANLAVVTTSPVTVTGSVDDPLALVDVNGVGATVDGLSGTFTATVPLQSGTNMVVATATNDAGDGSAEISVILNLAGTPAVAIATPADKWLVGSAYLQSATPTPVQYTVKGVIRVFTNEVANTPSVTVKGIAATLGDTSYGTGCAGLPKHCFKFTAVVPLPLGLHNFDVIGTDVLGGADTAAITVRSDVAYRPTDAQWSDEQKTVAPVPWSGPTPRLAALTQTVAGTLIQNNRAHEVDGCSVPVLIEQQGTFRNDPMTRKGNSRRKASTAFGSGSRPPSEYFIHGKSPAAKLPCNVHDVCYQTIGKTQAVCDGQMKTDMYAVCSKAYPEDMLPKVLYPLYYDERNRCFALADEYYFGVKNFGKGKFDMRQAQFRFP